VEVLIQGWCGWGWNSIAITEQGALFDEDRRGCQQKRLCGQTGEENVMTINKTASRKKTAAPRVSCSPTNSKRPMACKMLLQTAFAS